MTASDYFHKIKTVFSVILLKRWQHAVHAHKTLTRNEDMYILECSKLKKQNKTKQKTRTENINIENFRMTKSMLKKLLQLFMFKHNCFQIIAISD